jgi:hypothetical protein
MKNLKFNPNGT